MNDLHAATARLDIAKSFDATFKRISDTIAAAEQSMLQLSQAAEAAKPTPGELGLTTAWSAEDWCQAYNVLSWRQAWPTMASWPPITSGRYHPSWLINWSKLLAPDPGLRSLMEIVRERQRRSVVHAEYRRRQHARARRKR